MGIWRDLNRHPADVLAGAIRRVARPAVQRMTMAPGEVVLGPGDDVRWEHIDPDRPEEPGVPKSVRDVADEVAQHEQVMTDLGSNLANAEMLLDQTRTEIAQSGAELATQLATFTTYMSESSATVQDAHNAAVAAQQAADAAWGKALSLEHGTGLVRNGGFEVGDPNPDDWPAPSTVVSYPTSGARNGTRYARYGNIGTSGAMYHQTFPASTGRSYYIEGWVRREGTADTDSVWVGVILRVKTSAGGYGFLYARVRPSALTTTGWTKVAGTVTVTTENVTEAVVAPYLAGGPVADWYHFDDVMAVDVTEAVEATRIANEAKALAAAAQTAAAAAQTAAEKAQTRADSSVQATRVEYAKHTSATVAPTSGWTTATQAHDPAMPYRWMRTVITYGSGATSTTGAVLVTGNDGAKGDQGDAGDKGDAGDPARVITLTATTQALTSTGSGATSPATAVVTGTATNTTISAWTYSVDGSATFSATAPAGVTRSGNVVTITGGSMTARTITVRMADSMGNADTLTVAKLFDGAPGSAGASATTVLLTNESHTFAGDATSALAGSATSAVWAFTGATRVVATVGTITGQPTGMTTSIASNGTVAPVITVTVTSALTQRSGVLTVPVTVAGVPFTRVLSWSLALAGTPGASGRGISSIIEQYYSSTSATTQTGGTWVNSPPAWANNRYIWTRSTITYTDGSTTTTTPVSVTGGAGPVGGDGRSVTGVDVEYYSSTSATALAGGSWQTTAPAWASGRWIWSRTTVTYDSGAPTTTTPVNLTGQTGGKGDAGISVLSVTPFYRRQASNLAAPAIPTTNPPSGWQDTEPDYLAGNVLYRTERVTYSGGSPSFAYTPVTKVAAWVIAAEALASANGRNSRTTSTSPATGSTNPNTGLPNVKGDTWWQWDNDTDRNVIGQWAWDGSAWRREMIDHQTISSVDINKLVVHGSAALKQAVIDALWAKVVRAYKITTDMLLVGAGGNLLPWDPKATTEPHVGWSGSTLSRLNDGDYGWCVSVTGAAITSGTWGTVISLRPGSTSANGRPGWDVVEGEAYRVRIGASAGGTYTNGTPRVRVIAQLRDLAGTLHTLALGEEVDPSYSGPSTFAELEVEIPAGAVSMEVFAQQNQPGLMMLYRAAITRMTDASLIVEGGVIARHVTASESLSAKVAQFLSLGVEKLTATEGTIVDLTVVRRFAARMIESGMLRIMDGSTVRGIWDTTGIRLRDAAGNVTIDLNGIANLLTGRLRTAVSGTRVEVRNAPTVLGGDAEVVLYDGAGNEGSTIKPGTVGVGPDKTTIRNRTGGGLDVFQDRTPTTWTTRGFELYDLPWVNFAASGPLSYRVIHGVVYIRGTRDAAWSGTTTIGTIPAGYRPAVQTAIPVAHGTGATITAVVRTTGAIDVIAVTDVTTTVTIGGSYPLG